MITQRIKCPRLPSLVTTRTARSYRVGTSQAGSRHWAVVRSGRESNPQPLDYETDAQTITPLRRRHSWTTRYINEYIGASAGRRAVRIAAAVAYINARQLIHR